MKIDFLISDYISLDIVFHVCDDDIYRLADENSAYEDTSQDHFHLSGRFFHRLHTKVTKNTNSMVKTTHFHVFYSMQALHLYDMLVSASFAAFL